ncbi:MAG: prepilin-type N-terminal cleavage/methylation domain-containing protein [Sulfuricaulis sp.]|uniref:PulJ/GspJ family protein n=1 Tax=Sulfuricaulis sp. TaxID=2003553 RepID=UPI003C373C32
MHTTPSSRRSVSQRVRRCAGVTLIELVVVITITGIIAVVLGSFIVSPIQGFQAQVHRAELVDAAEMALRQTARDIRRALPNSVRIRDSLGNVNNVTCNAAGVTCAIEMLNTVDGARYREGPGTNPGGHIHADPQYRLHINATDNDGFNIIGFFRNIQTDFVLPYNSAAQNPPSRLAIYNQGVTGADAYADGDESSLPAPSRYVITRPGVTSFSINNDDGADEHHVSLVAGTFRFRWASPNQRVFIVDTPITYLCTGGAGGNIRRYRNYAITTAQPTNPGAAPLSAVTGALLTTPVTRCAFSYSPGTNQRAGLVTLDITVADASGETVRLLYQVHVDNSP